MDPVDIVRNSPYGCFANSPLNLVDKNGLEPIDPRTGRPIDLNLNRAAVHNHRYIDFAKLSVLRDDDLYERANNKIFPRSRNVFGGTKEEGAAYNIHESVWEHTSDQAVNSLRGLFREMKYPNGDWDSPNDAMWRYVAELGTYTFLDDCFSESEVFHIDQTSFNIYTVEQNYITRVVSLSRESGGEEYEIEKVTSFDIRKGAIQSREVQTWWGGTRKERFRVLTVSETTQEYTNNEPNGNCTYTTYRREEILD